MNKKSKIVWSEGLKSRLKQGKLRTGMGMNEDCRVDVEDCRVEIEDYRVDA